MAEWREWFAAAGVDSAVDGSSAERITADNQVLEVATAVASGACQYLTTRALYHAPVGAVAPLNYTKMVWAVLVGFLWFGDVPTIGMLLGSATVILAGLIVYRDQR